MNCTLVLRLHAHWCILVLAYAHPPARTDHVATIATVNREYAHDSGSDVILLVSSCTTTRNKQNDSANQTIKQRNSAAQTSYESITNRDEFDGTTSVNQRGQCLEDRARVGRAGCWAKKRERGTSSLKNQAGMGKETDQVGNEMLLQPAAQTSRSDEC